MSISLSLLPNTSDIYYYPLREIAGKDIDFLPFSLRILLESALRQAGSNEAARQAADAIRQWKPDSKDRPAIPFAPARVLMQDFTGVPAIVDLAAMREALSRMGGNPSELEPVIPVDLVIDHSVQVDYTGVPNALQLNLSKEYERNIERYQLLKWAQEAFKTVRVVPPSKGIIHQINLEHLATVVVVREVDGKQVAMPDSVFGTDSHTTMINGLGVLGWGVGGIEAVSAMLGKAVDILLPDVIGLEFAGRLPEGVTPTDLILTIVERLRQEGVVGKFIEGFGDGLDSLSLPDRAMISNMTPETGATAIFFPVDAGTLNYLRLTGRSEEQVTLVETYCRAQGLFRDADTVIPTFTKVITIELSGIEACVAGPTRPQDRIAIRHMKEAFAEAMDRPRSERGFAVPANEWNNTCSVKIDGEEVMLSHGSLLIAAITSCTNTSNPTVLLSAGLLAKNAVERGLSVNPVVKCSLMPGSRVVTAYLEKAGLLDSLAALGFDLTGYGCGSCIGNSGPLNQRVVDAVREHGIVAASISSANRNFEGRISPHTRANYLASPPFVVAHALAGTMNINLMTDPLGVDANGRPVLLSDIFPSQAEVEALFESITPQLFKESYQDLFEGDVTWQAINTSSSARFKWQDDSTYIQEPPYFEGMTGDRLEKITPIHDARVLVMLGDSITTDHISPAGAIPSTSDAGQYLRRLGLKTVEFNSFGSRRGNDRVMVRGTFGNIRIKNQLVPGVEGSVTRHFDSGEQMSIFQASQRYQDEDVPLIVIAGKEYGTGSSRDWAAKGPMLLRVKVVIAESFERIHRSNLVGMGVLPLQFLANQNAQSLGITGEERFSFDSLDGFVPQGVQTVSVVNAEGIRMEFQARVRIDTAAELAMFHAGGILHEALYDRLG
ncbi:MAG: aconitate hydratase AcnA [Anaerolineaceae bacterium]|nr:aconitate hydratase AcnA [Anaerolineaceae bacterium]